MVRPHASHAPSGSESRVFNNADSFAQAFDDAWQEHERRNPSHGLDRHDKRDLILSGLTHHPFLQSSPELARQVADFRLRLLDL